MDFWFVEIGEPLPVEHGRRLLRYGRFTEWLAARGHDVTWWACDFSHAAKAHVTSSGDHWIGERLRLVALHGPGYRHNLSLARVRHQRVVARELRGALDAAAAQGRLPDLVFCPIPTIENADVVQEFASTHRIPYLLDIRDEWPAEFVRLVPAPLRPLARLALRSQFEVARRAARGAAGIVGVTQRQLEYGLALAGRSFDPNRDCVLYHGYTRPEIPSETQREAEVWWRSQGLMPDARVVAFAGTLGVSFDFGPVLAVARALQLEGRSDVQFVVAGDGGARKRLVSAAGELAGRTVLFPGWIDQPRIDALLRRSSVGLAPYIPGTSMSLPNKFFEYMAYGLPILSSCSGESETLLRSHAVGIQYDPTDASSLRRALTMVLDDETARNAMSARSRALFCSRFEHRKLHTDMEARIVALLDEPTTPKGRLATVTQ